MGAPGWRRGAGRLARGLRDAWLIAGVVAAMLVALELAYRAQAALRAGFRAGRAAPDPAAGAVQLRMADKPYPDAGGAWWVPFHGEISRVFFRYEPFVYNRAQPFAGRYVNVDSAGLRVTPRYPRPGRPPLRVFFFGGSTTFGVLERDSMTRPAQVARRLAEAGWDAEVVNFAQLAYVGSQELLTLVLELRRGNVPDAVVFWDGVNEIGSARINGRPGVSYGEWRREEDARFNLERARRGGLVNDRTALRTLLAHSALFRRLMGAAARPTPVRPPADPLLFCREVMAQWFGQVRVVERLAAAYGFTALVVWQPQWELSDRPRTDWERRYATRLPPQEAGLAAHRGECARVVDSVVAAGTLPSVRNWAALHRDDPGTVFHDEMGHTTERVTALEADTVTNVLLARLWAQGARGGRGGRGGRSAPRARRASRHGAPSRLARARRCRLTSPSRHTLSVNGPRREARYPPQVRVPWRTRCRAARKSESRITHLRSWVGVSTPG